MSIIVIILALLCIYRVKIADKGSLFPDYMDKDKTIAIEGIFVLLVFIRHFFRYDIPLDGQYDGFAKDLDSALSQLLVTMFLFYSGFGIMESVTLKKNYIRSLPGKALKLLIRFDVAIILFLLVNACCGSVYSVEKIALSLLGWESVGNSNWYIFVIIILYLISWISFSVFKRNKLLSLAAVTGISILFVYIVQVRKMEFWYNTILCYPLGMWYSLLLSSIRSRETKKESRFSGKRTIIIYLSTTLIFAVLYAVSYSFRNNNLWTYYAWTLAFVSIVVLITMKVRFDNAFLQLLGKHVFSIYILQRIPMIILQSSGYIKTQPYFSFIISLLATIVGAILFDNMILFLDHKISLLKKKRHITENNDRKQEFNSNTIKPISVILYIFIVIISIVVSPMISSNNRSIIISAQGEKNESALMADVFIKKIKLNNQSFSVPKPSDGNWTWYKDHYCWLENSDTRTGETITNTINLEMSFQGNTQLVFSGNKWKGILHVSSDDWEKKVDTYVDDDGWNDVIVSLPEPTVMQFVKYSVLPGISFTALLLIGGMIALIPSYVSNNRKNRKKQLAERCL